MTDITGLGASVLTQRTRGRLYDGPATDAAAASVRLAFRVPPGDVETASEQLSAAGVEILEPVTDQPWGHRTSFFADPENNALEIYADI